MRRALPLAALLALLLLALTGCAGSGGPVPTAGKAGPQSGKARLGRALPGKEAGTGLQGRLVHGHADRLVGPDLGREHLGHRLVGGRRAKRGAARIRRDAVPERRQEGDRGAQQEQRPACDPRRDELHAGPPGRPQVGKDVERRHRCARRTRGGSLGSHLLRPVHERRRATGRRLADRAVVHGPRLSARRGRGLGPARLTT